MSKVGDHADYKACQNPTRHTSPRNKFVICELGARGDQEHRRNSCPTANWEEANIDRCNHSALEVRLGR